MFSFVLPSCLKPSSVNDLLLVGRNCDGGYYTSKIALDETTELLSFGINDDWSFEADFAALNKDVKISCYDGSVDRSFFLKQVLKNTIFLRPKLLSHYLRTYFTFRKFFEGQPNNYFYKKFIGPHNDESYRPFSPLCENLNKLFVKIDIEGGEYRLLEKLIENQEKFTGLIIEFHDVDLHMEKIVKFCKAINLRIINVNVNNYGLVNFDLNLPTVIEVSWIKNNPRTINSLDSAKEHQLKNNPNGFDYELNFN
ncbi:hypothetical protein N8Z87_05305 [Amylibacter sp.]|nr:hypothetical protein [Amylibacter sp.]